MTTAARLAALALTAAHRIGGLCGETPRTERVPAQDNSSSRLFRHSPVRSCAVHAQSELRRPGLWVAPAAIVIGLLAGVFSTLLIEVIGAGFGSSVDHPSPAVSLLASLAFDLSFVAAALYLTTLRRVTAFGAAPRVDFGYHRISWRRGVGAVLAAAVVYYLVSAGYSALVSLHGTDHLPSELGFSTSTAAKVGTAVFVCVVAPILEEFFFRGFLFGVLSQMRVRIGGRELGPWVAALIVAVLFGLAHSGSASAKYLVPLGILGFILCIVRWRSGSLYPCMALHSLNNSVALGVNELNWHAGLIVALAIGSLAVVGALTWPLSRQRAHRSHDSQ